MNILAYSGDGWVDWIEEEDIPMDSVQIDLNIEGA